MENYFYRKLVFAKSKSSGTSNYADLANKPQINGVELVGNKTSEDLGIEQGVTEEVLTQALAAESAARQKQDELLQGEIEGKIAAANILAGENIEVSQDGSNVTISSTGSSGGATYTAGTNIEITEDNVINNTIPYLEDEKHDILIGEQGENRNNNSWGNCIDIGYNNDNLNGDCIRIGHNTHVNMITGRALVIGNEISNNVGTDCVIIGHSAGSTYSGEDGNGAKYGIALGYWARLTKDYQFVLGSSNAPINEMKVVTSDGDKYIATTDQTVPTGGTTRQVLMKNSDADYDFSWTSLADYDEVSF